MISKKEDEGKRIINWGLACGVDNDGTSMCR